MFQRKSWWRILANIFVRNHSVTFNCLSSDQKQNEVIKSQIQEKMWGMDFSLVPFRQARSASFITIVSNAKVFFPYLFYRLTNGGSK